MTTITAYWASIIFLSCLAIPGARIAMPRLISLLLPAVSGVQKKRITLLVTVQSIAMIFFMSAAGTFFSLRTGLVDPFLLHILFDRNKSVPFLELLNSLLLPVFLYTSAGLAVFLFLFYTLGKNLLDNQTMTALKRLRAAFRLDGCMLYGGITEELLYRWGLMNLIVFFAQYFSGRSDALILWSSMILVSFLYTMGHYPAFIAAGCQNNRRFVCFFLLMSTFKCCLFGLIFWKYGILSAMTAHMLFHLGWYLYDPAVLKNENETA